MAVQVPTFDVPNLSVAGSPGLDFRGLTVSFAQAQGGGYTLNATGSGTFTFYSPDTAHAYAGTGGSYALSAAFNADGSYAGTGSLTIKGALAGTPSAWGTAPTATTTLWSTQLPEFGYSQSQDALGFKTTTFGGWANKPMFTGGSTAESLYLFDFLGVNGGNGSLQPLVNALASHNPAAGVGTYNVVESIATVPIPAPFILFGSGVLSLFGLRRKRTIKA